MMTSILCGLIAGCCFGGTNPLLASASRTLGSLSTTMIYNLASFVVLSLLVIINPFGMMAGGKQALSDLLPPLFAGALLGVFAAVASIVLTKCLEYGPLALVCSIFSVNGPCAAVAALFLFNEPLTLFQIPVLIMTGIGCVLVSLPNRRGGTGAKGVVPPDRRGVQAGVLLAMLAALLFAILEVGIGALSKQMTSLFLLPMVVLRASSTLMLAVMLLIAIAHGKQTNETGSRQTGLAIMLAVGSGMLDGAGYCALVMGTKALFSVTMTVAVAMNTLLPLVVGFLIWRERNTRWQLVGMAIIVAGVISFPLSTFLLIGVLILQYLFFPYALWCWLGHFFTRVPHCDVPIDNGQREELLK